MVRRTAAPPAGRGPPVTFERYRSLAPRAVGPATPSPKKPLARQQEPSPTFEPEEETDEEQEEPGDSGRSDQTDSDREEEEPESEGHVEDHLAGRRPSTTSPVRRAEPTPARRTVVTTSKRQHIFPPARPLKNGPRHAPDLFETYDDGEGFAPEPPLEPEAPLPMSLSGETMAPSNGLSLTPGFPPKGSPVTTNPDAWPEAPSFQPKPPSSSKGIGGSKQCLP